MGTSARTTASRPSLCPAYGSNPRIIFKEGLAETRAPTEEAAVLQAAAGLWRTGRPGIASGITAQVHRLGAVAGVTLRERSAQAAGQSAGQQLRQHRQLATSARLRARTLIRHAECYTTGRGLLVFNRVNAFHCFHSGGGRCGDKGKQEVKRNMRAGMANKPKPECWDKWD